MSNRNTAYDDNTSVLGWVTSTVIGAGVVHFGSQLILDPKNFRASVEKVYNKISETVDPVYSSYDAAIARQRENLPNIAKTRAQNISTRANRTVDISTMTKPLVSNVDGLTHSTKFARRSFTYNNINELGDVGTSIINSLKQNYNLDIIGDVEFKGTAGIINYKMPGSNNVRKLKIPFAKQTQTGEMIVKDGQATYVAPGTYRYGTTANKELTGEMHVSDWNQSLKRIFNQQDAIYHIAALSDEHEKLFTSETLSELRRATSYEDYHLMAVQKLKEVSFNRVAASAIKVLEGDRLWASPGSPVMVDKTSSLVRPDAMQVYELGKEHAGLNQYQLGRSPASPYWDTYRSNIGEGIKKRYTTAIGASGPSITYNNFALDAPELSGELNPLLHGLRRNGLTPNVAAGQSAVGTLNAAGAIHTPAMADSMKTISDFSWKKPRGAVSSWRTAQRYVSEDKLSATLENIGGTQNVFGYLDFLGGEGLTVNKDTSISKLLRVESTPQIRFSGYDIEKAKRQKISVQSVNGKHKIDKFTLHDLYNDETTTGKELRMYMTDPKYAGQYEIHGITKGSYLGIDIPAKHIDDIIDINNLGNEAEELRMRYGYGYMTSREYQNMLELRTEDTMTLPLRIIEDAYKGGVFGTQSRQELWRTSFKKGPSRLKEMVRLSGNKNIDMAIGIDLFKNMRGVLSGGELYGMKGAPGLMAYTHNLIGGMVHDMSLKGQNVILEGESAKVMASMLENRGGIRSGAINLTSVVNNGMFKFNLPINDPEKYQEMLSGSIDVLGTMMRNYQEKDGSFRLSMLDSNAKENLDKYFSYAKERWDDFSLTGREFEDAERRKVLFPILPSITPMEGMALIQGKNIFNAGRYSMRDIGNMLTMPDIYKEILTRSEVDTVRLVKEAQLLQSSIGTTEQNRAMFAQAKEHIEYLKYAYGDDPHIKALEAQLGEMSNEERILDIQNWGGPGSVDLNKLRSNPNVAQQSPLNKEYNKFGKFFQVDDGRIAFAPSAESIGGLTAINQERATFEGHASIIQEMLASAMQTGKINSGVMDNLTSKIHSLSEYIIGERSKSVIPDAAYAKNVPSERLANHSIIKILHENTNIDNDIKNVLGSIVGTDVATSEAAWSQRWAAAQARVKDGQTVTDAMAEIFGGEIAIGNKVKNYANMLGNKKNMPAKVTKMMMEQRLKDSSTLHGMLNKLEDFYYNGYKVSDPKSEKLLEDMARSVAGFIQTKGARILADRQPDIYPTSNMVAYGFLDSSLYEKQMTTGHLMNIQQNADYDGDAQKLIELITKNSRADADRYIKNVQKNVVDIMSNHKKRVKMLGGSASETWNIGDKFGKHIFDMDLASSYASFFTKGYTGSMNVAARQIKEMQDILIKSNLKGGVEKLEAVRSWAIAMPSLLMEQPVISSKHLARILGKGATQANGMTAGERILENLDSLKQADVLEVFKESKGIIDPVMQMLLTDIQNTPGRRSEYSEALKVGDVLMDYQAGFSRFTDEKYKILQEYSGMNDADFAELRSKHEQMQEASTPFRETEAAIESGLSKKKMIDIWAEGANMSSRSYIKMSKELQTGKNAIPNFIHMSDTDQHKEIMKRLTSEGLNLPFDILGAEASTSLPKQSRHLKGINRLKGLAEKVSEFYKEAPTERGLGTMIVAGAALMTANLLTGSVPSNPSDMPSANNPVMGHNGINTISGHGRISPNSSYNMNNSLLTDSSHHMRTVSSSISSIVGLNGHHTVNVRSDNTDPYLSSMQYYN